MELPSKLIEIFNLVSDNLWLGDIKESRQLISESLAKIEDKKHYYISMLHKLRYLYRELRRNLKKEYKGLNLSRIVAAKFNEEIKRSKLIPEDAIIGMIIEHMEKMLKALEYTMEAEPITRKEKYEYVIYQIFKPTYEAKAIIPTLKKAKTEKLEDVLRKLGFYPQIIGETKTFVSFVAFSNEVYLEVIVFPPRMHIVLKTLPRTKEAIKEIVEKIIESQI